MSRQESVPIALVVRLPAKPRREAALRQTLLENRAASLQETGRLLYEVHEPTEEPAVSFLSARQSPLDGPRIAGWRRLEGAQRAVGC